MWAECAPKKRIEQKIVLALKIKIFVKNCQFCWGHLVNDTREEDLLSFNGYDVILKKLVNNFEGTDLPKTKILSDFEF